MSMMSGGAGTGDAASQLAQLRSAAAAVRAAVSTAAPVPCPATADTADWESRLAAVNAAVGGSARPTNDQSGSGGPTGDGNGRTDDAAGRAVHAPYQAELINSISNCPGNCVTFLPLGLGLRSVVDSVLVRAVAQHPGKHVLLVVDRPAHALSHAQRLRTELGLPTAVFCGGDFLYSFPQQFQTSRVLVFTAGLLLRLLKTGVYSLEQASLMLLLDAFTVVRNHPSNTLVREYWRGAEEGHRPRVVGVLASQLPSKPRPFDRLRQNLRKLCHSLQAALLLPAGCGLAQMEAQLHHDAIQLHSYALGTPEERLASLLQQHLLGLWDVLHEFGLNHFGRLVQFAAASSGPGVGGGGTPGTQPGTPAAGTPAGACATPPRSAGAGAGQSTRTPDQHSPAPGTPLSGGGSPGRVEGSPGTPLHGLLQGGVAGGQHAGGSSAAAAAAEQPDPMQHDWAQVELQVIHSLWHSNALPSKGEHVREPDALALQMHVLDCVRALRALLEQGPVACLARLPQALDSLADFMSEGVGLGGMPGAVAVPPLRARILQVAGASPLLPWALQEQKRAAAAEEAGARQAAQQAAAGVQLGQGLQAGAGVLAGEERREAAMAAGAATPPRAQPPRPRASPQPKPSPRRMASGGGAASLADGPQAAVAAGSARVAATLQLLQELQVGCQLSGQRRLTAVVAGSREAVAMLQQVIGETQELQFAEVRELREALSDPEGLSRAASSAAAAAAAAAAAGLSRAVSLGRAASLGRTGSFGPPQMGSNGAAAAAGSSAGGSSQADLQKNGQLAAGQQEGDAASGAGEAGEAPANAAVGAVGAAEGTEPSPAQGTGPAGEAAAATDGIAAPTEPQPAAQGSEEAEAVSGAANETAERRAGSGGAAAEPEAPGADGIAGTASDSGEVVAATEAPAADAAGTSSTSSDSGEAAAVLEASAAYAAGTSCSSVNAAVLEAPAATAAGTAGAAALDLVTSPSETEAAFAAAWAHAAPTVRVGQLVVHLLTSADLADLERHISSYHSLVWYSAGDVLHAASQELESAALAACHRLSAAYTAAASAAADAARKSRRSMKRLECHVLSTGSQVLALGEVRRVDHSLKAAMELVGLGDSTAEEKLTMLAHRNTAGVLEPEARAILEMLCCGLCGAAPAFATMTASPMRKPSSSSRRLAAAAEVTAAAAAEVPLAAAEGGPEGSGGASGRVIGKEEGDEAAGELPPGVSLTTAGTAGGGSAGAGAASDGEDGQLAAAATQPSILFRSSITLPAAYFPPERFHSQGVSMPMDVFVGPALPSEEQAANAAALLALAALHRLGIIVRYWPSRLLLAQHLLPRSLAAAGVPASALQQGAGGSAAEAANAAWAAAIGAPTAGMQMQQQMPTQQQQMQMHQLPSQQQQQQQQQAPTNVTNFFCPLCNVAATGHKAFDAHLRGFRHQRRIKQAQLLQQGQEVSAMLQGLLLDETSPAAAAAAAAAAAGGGGGGGGGMFGVPHGVAVRRPALDELMEEEEGGEHGSPTFADRQVYSPEPTPYRCDTCGVYCTSERLLEAHTRGRKHQRRVAGIDSPAGRPSSPKVQPLVTPYFCAMCGLYATSEEQLRMHMLGKRHTRMTQLHRQRMQGVGGESGAPASLQQQHHQLLVAAAAAAALSSGAAAWVPSSSSGVASAFEVGEIPLPSPAMGGPSVALLGSGAPTTMLDGMGGGGDGMGAVALHGLLLDSSGNQRIYRCDLCGVVTPSRRHYDYHLQGIKHTRRAMRAQGLDPGSASQPGTPASCGSPAAGSRSSSPVGRAGRGRHSRHGSADWGASSGTGGGAGAAGGPADAAPESLICSVCGIMATSAVNLEDHYKGRRHQKNVERQQAQAAAASASVSGGPGVGTGTGGLPPLSPLSAGPSPFAGAAAIKGAPASLQRMPSLNRSQSGITLGADGLRLPSGALLSANSLLGATGGLQRSNSEVYDDFPCVRIGSILLPSSMDLRTFLEEMQHLDGTEEMEADLLPTIEEHHETVGAELAAAVGAGLGHGLLPGGTSSASAGAGANTNLAASAQLFTPSPTAAGAGAVPPQQSWSYLPVASIAGAGAGAGAGGGPSSGTASPAQTSRSAGGSTPRGPQYQHGGSRTQPSSPSMYLPPAAGTGAFGRGGSSSRPGSAGGGPRLSRFAQDQLQQAQQAQQLVAQQQAQQQAAAAAGLGYAGQQYGAAYGQQYGHGQQYGMAPGGSHAVGMPAGYAMQHSMGMTQQAHTAYANAAGYTAAYAPDVSAALAVQQAAAMQQHQQMAAAYGAGMAGHHGTAYAGMATQQGQQVYYQAQPPPPPPPPPSNRYR